MYVDHERLDEEEEKRSVFSSYLRKERPFVLFKFQTVDDETFHGFGAVTVQLAEVWGQVASTHHENDLE